MLALVGVVALAAGCGGEGSGSGAEGGGGGRLSIATGGTSGVYFVYGGGLAKVISSNLEGYKATAETTSASVDNLILIKDGGSDIAFTLADTALDAVEGREAFKEKVPMRVLAQIYDNYTQVVAKAGLGHQDDRGPQGQARLRRRPELRHRGHRRPRARGGGHGPQGRHQAPGPRRRGVGAGDEGRLDRRLLLVRRPAHRRDHRPRDDATRSRCSTRPSTPTS